MIRYLLGNGSANGSRKSYMLKLHVISIEKEWGQIRMQNTERNVYAHI